MQEAQIALKQDGFEGAGVVDATGGGILGKLRQGRRVAVLNGKGGNWQQYVIVPAKQDKRIQSDLGGHIPKLEDQPWPAFPADVMSIAIVTATQCEGVVMMHEKMFESRMFFVDKLIGMGARIILCDPHRAVVVGPSRLRGAQVESPDIRAGMAILLAALCASGESTIDNVGQIERGYERIDERLRALGAKIDRVEERRQS